MKKLSSIIIVLITLLLFQVAAQALTITGLTAGYGYGYGECTAAAPNGLRAKNVRAKNTVLLSWQAIEFDDCDTTKADYYDLKIYTINGGLVESYSDIAKTHKNIPSGTLKSNRAYKFKVRAVADDGVKTKWSKAKVFRTTPKAPDQVIVAQIRQTTAYVSWRNIIRSQFLKHYLVRVKQGNEVVFTTNHKIALRKARTGLTLEDLQPNTLYTVELRSVFSKKLRSKISSTTFTTLAVQKNQTVILGR